MQSNFPQYITENSPYNICYALGHIENSEMVMYLAKIGLVLNVVGTIMVALSFGKNLAEAHQMDEKGRRIYLAAFRYPKLFYWGLAILVIGLIFQFMG